MLYKLSSIQLRNKLQNKAVSLVVFNIELLGWAALGIDVKKSYN